MISVLSPIRTCAFWSTTIMSPSSALILPRTRVGACAATLAATSSRTNARLLRWIDAIFAHRHASGHELAVVAHACAAEDRRTGLQVGAAAGREVVVLGFRRHQDLL